MTSFLTVNVDGRLYRVTIMPPHTPGYAQQVHRVRKDGTLGRRLQGWGEEARKVRRFAQA